MSEYGICVKISQDTDLIDELADGAGLFVAQRGRRLLEGADHGWRTADQNLDVVGGLGKPFLRRGSC